MPANAFAVRHRSDRTFFLVFVIVGWVSVYRGFAGDIAKRFAGGSDYAAPAILILHIAVFFGWMLLLTAQVILIRFGGHRLHRRLGVAMIVMAPLIVVSGIGAELVSQRFYSVKDPANLGFFAYPLSEMVLFIAFVAGAWRWRRDPSTHKRLIVAATAPLLSAGFFRWWGDPLFATFGDGSAGRWIANYSGPNLLIAAAVLHDLATRRRVQRVWQMAVPSMLAVQAAAVALSDSPEWRETVRGLIGI